MREPTFQEFVGLCLDAEEILRQLRRSKFCLDLQGKKPSGLKASVLWLLAQQKDLHVTQHHLSFVFSNVTTATIMNNVRLLKPMLKEIVLEVV